MENNANDVPSISELEAMFLAEEFDAQKEVTPMLSDPRTDNNCNNSFPKMFDDHNFLESAAPGDVYSNKMVSKTSADSFKGSAVHKGDTDSSDDEDERNFLERKYNEYGKQIKTILDREDIRKKDKEFEYLASKSNIVNEKSNITKPLNTRHELSVAKPVKREMKIDVHTDPVFGIRIVNPLISSARLLEKMKGRTPVSMSKVRKHTEAGDLSQDWVVAGAIISKSPVKTSQKGNQFSIWLLSDLRDDLKTVSLFLFKNAHKDLWKTSQGTVVGILNPGVLDRRDDSKDEATLSIDNSQKMMIFGQSKDLGLCKSRKKNGDPCTSFVNLHQCEYCIYHVKQVYQQASRRSELQSACAGRGLNSLRNKVLGKSEVFYAGQSFTAIPAQKNRKHLAKDRSRLDLLSDYNRSSNNTTGNAMKEMMTAARQTANKLNASRVEHSVKQREKDMERLRILKGSSEKIETPLLPIENKETKDEPIVKPTNRFLNALTTGQEASVPKLSLGSGKNFEIDFSAPIRKVQDIAKLNALKWVQKNGPIKKSNPGNLKGTETGKKRAMERLDEISPKRLKSEPKTTGVQSERFKKLMAATSANVHLLEQHEEEKREEYFRKLEKKEQMEEKMIGTFKVACKAVRCIICNYTSFSASAKCKEMKHPLRVFDSFKRFFKCLDCKNRTVTLDLLPKLSCKNCQGSRWEKTGMMNEKIIKTAGEVLSIRGDEEQFIGAERMGGNLNLLVPDNV